MTHRFPVKEVALQAGVSTATVDRVMHGRPNVSPQTIKRVRDAISELEGQEGQLAARGRRLFVDVVVEAPVRFSREIRHALETEIQAFRPAVIRPRYTFHELMEEAAVQNALTRIGNRGSQGVLLKVRDEPEIREAVAMLTNRGIPVVTIFTDLPNSRRIGYAGIDNRAAGKTAAYLVDRTLSVKPGTVIITRSNEAFRGEEDRAEGFREALAGRSDLTVLDASGGAGLYLSTATQIEAVLAEAGIVRAIYSVGGGNRAILDTLQKAGIEPEVFVAHDLDHENARLLEDRRIDFVLHDDLRRDIRAALQHILAHHRLLRLTVMPECSDILVITPANMQQWR